MAKSWKVFRITNRRIRCIFCGHEEDLPEYANPPARMADDPAYQATVAFFHRHKDCEEQRPAVIVMDKRAGQETAPRALADAWDYQRGYSQWDFDKGQGLHTIDYVLRSLTA